MVVRPMVGSWEVPRIERIWSHEARRVGLLPVPGLSGDLQQDLGKGALTVEIQGSLTGDEARDVFLEELRDKFYTAEPVDFVADIVLDAELEQVLILAFEVEEVAGSTDSFRYRLVLREYTEPPEPAGFGPGGLGAGFGLDVDADLGLDVDLGLDLLDLPGILGSVPEIGDLLAPVEQAAADLRKALEGAGKVLEPLETLLGGG
jgi:hypothetical protein